MQYFLDETNIKRGWYHTTSPLIWKELCYRGGKAYLIGGLSEFWEYCYDYYGLISKIPYEELCRLAAEHKEVCMLFIQNSLVPLDKNFESNQIYVSSSFRGLIVSVLSINLFKNYY